MMIGRREVLAASVLGGGALVLGVLLPHTSPGPPFVPNAWLSIGGDGSVTLTVAKSEMGQGVSTALPMLLAEELEVDWSAVTVRQAEVRAGDSYQNTGGSSSVTDSWELLRRAGAVARVMLTTAAAAMWEVPIAECLARNGSVIHRPSGRQVEYGELTERAATLPVPDPASVTLKDPSAFRIIGTRLPRVDSAAKVKGQAIYGIDVRVPGMLHAVAERCPFFGGQLRKYSATAALAVPGVKHVVVLAPVSAPIHLPPRVAVVATSTWSALQGRRALEVEWEAGPNNTLSSDDISARFANAVAGAARTIVSKGETAAHFDGRPHLDARYEVPFLAHQMMEPGNCTASATATGIEIWAPTQFPTYAQRHVARLTGIAPEAIRLHVTFMGGGFGRRINADFIVEAVQVSKAVGAPVQTLWTREDDVRHDVYRPAGLQHIRAAVLDGGTAQLRAPSLVWEHRLIGPSTNTFYTPGHARPEEQELWGASELPYRIAAHRLEYAEVNTPVPIGWWRAVAYSQNVFAIECALNELADLANADHVALRHALLGEHPRLQGVLALVAERGSWSKAMPAGSGRGIAACKYDGTYVAQVIEVSVGERSEVTVHRVVCAIDCGVMVNPSGLEAQVEGSIIWGLSAALTGEITVARGGIVQSNFHDAPVLRMNQIPRIEVHVIRSTAPPSGAGEPAVVPVAPALVDAIHAAVGIRLRKLPVNRHLLQPNDA